MLEINTGVINLSIHVPLNQTTNFFMARGGHVY